MAGVVIRSHLLELHANALNGAAHVVPGVACERSLVNQIERDPVEVPVAEGRAREFVIRERLLA